MSPRVRLGVDRLKAGLAAALEDPDEQAAIYTDKHKYLRGSEE
ncbi:MAG: hypothetical protein ACTS5I_02270 [Rhodanobacter sp.]